MITKIKRLISLKQAGSILLFLNILLVLFHLLVILKIVPSDIIAGGQFKDSTDNLILFVLFAILLLLLISFIVAVKIGYILPIKPRKWINICIWIIFAYFILITLGNIASQVRIENLLFAPITVIMVLLTFRIAIEK